MQRATQGVHDAVGGMSYPAGSFVVSMAQPKMGLIRYLLGRTFYPDNEWTRDRDGSPIRPYDMATDTMFEFMGVRVDPLDDVSELRGVALREGAGPIEPAGKLTRGAERLLDRRAAERCVSGGESAVRQECRGAARG